MEEQHLKGHCCSPRGSVRRAQLQNLPAKSTDWCVLGLQRKPHSWRVKARSGKATFSRLEVQAPEAVICSDLPEVTYSSRV